MGGLHLPSEISMGRQRLQQPLHAASHALLVTDGVPTLGCSSLAAERDEAVGMGVSVHTVFIGNNKEYPEALGNLAEATGGVRFQAIIDHHTGYVKLFDRDH